MAINLQECKSFFIDSGVLIDLLKTDLSATTADVSQRIELTRLFFDCIANPEFFAKSKERVYQLSAISIAEIFHVNNDQDSTMNAIVNILDTNQVEVFSFDVHTALFHNKEFHDYLGNKVVEKMMEELQYPISMYSNIKDRIRKDILIAATAKLYSSDIVLTNDGGFKKLCDKLKVKCYCFTNNKSDFLMNNGETAIFGFAPHIV